MDTNAYLNLLGYLPGSHVRCEYTSSQAIPLGAREVLLLRCALAPTEYSQQLSLSFYRRQDCVPVLIYSTHTEEVRYNTHL